ncbi:hypothetical protein [Microbacterium sp.]|uniref:hypothetical protein n=1 Tax=Microbacterium sp. TaxID=51671 RepID=UPI0027374D60|nr:hypothetical protein [Microbacterium sp.]
MTSSSEQIVARESAGGGISRRTVVNAAAWSVPVIAAAVAVPLAAASTSQASIAALVGSTITANSSSGAASGEFATSGMRISNVSGEWSTGVLTAAYRLQGPWATASLSKPDGSPFVQGETIVHGGTAWTVTMILADSDGTWEVHFSGAPVTVTADITISMPSAIYSGTFSPGIPSTRNPILATVSVAAAAVNSGDGAASSASYPV